MSELITVEELLTDPDFAQTLVLRRNTGAYNKYGEWSSASILTESSDAVPSALQGSVYWYDIGLTNEGESVYYDLSDTYAYWFDGSDWLITISADVGGTPTNYFKLVG